MDASGNLYIADTMNAKVRKVSAASGVITTVAGSGTAGYGGDGGAAASAQLNLPIGVAVDSSGNVYIADFGNSRVRKVSASGAIIGTVAGNGSTGYSGDGGPAANAQLNGPQGVAVDAAGNLYIADTENNAIREVTPAGLIATVAGNGLAGYSGDGGQATSAQVGNPVGVAVDAAGDIFTVDASNRVRQVYPNGLIATIAGNGSRGYSGDGGLATQAQLNAPSAIALGNNGNLYVADKANNAVRLLQYAGNGLSIGAVTNAASSVGGPVAPGEVVVLYGSGLGPAQLTQYQLDPTSGLVGTSLAGTSVIFGGTPAPVLYTSATQIGAVVPYSVAGSNVQVFVQYQGQSQRSRDSASGRGGPGSLHGGQFRQGPGGGLQPGRDSERGGSSRQSGELHLVVADRRGPDESRGRGRSAGSRSSAAAGGSGRRDDWRTIRDAAVRRPGALRGSRRDADQRANPQRYSGRQRRPGGGAGGRRLHAGRRDHGGGELARQATDYRTPGAAVAEELEH